MAHNQMLALALETLRTSEFLPIALSEDGIDGVPAFAQLKDQIVGVRKVSNSETGCNLYFTDQLIVLDLDQPGIEIGGWQASDPSFPSLVDAIITWVVNPDLAYEMFVAGTGEDEESVVSYEGPREEAGFFNGFNPEEEE
jgi:hypothetical protein